MIIHLSSSSAAKPEAKGQEDSRLVSSAHEFEASLMKELLKPLQEDSLFAEDTPGQADDEEDSANALMSFGSQAMATAISEHGGFGIATMILDHFETQPDASHRAANLRSSESGAAQITKVINPPADESQ